MSLLILFVYFFYAPHPTTISVDNLMEVANSYRYPDVLFYVPPTVFSLFFYFDRLKSLRGKETLKINILFLLAALSFIYILTPKTKYWFYVSYDSILIFILVLMFWYLIVHAFTKAQPSDIGENVKSVTLLKEKKRAYFKPDDTGCYLSALFFFILFYSRPSIPCATSCYARTYLFSALLCSPDRCLLLSLQRSNEVFTHKGKAEGQHPFSPLRIAARLCIIPPDKALVFY